MKKSNLMLSLAMLTLLAGSASAQFPVWPKGDEGHIIDPTPALCRDMAEDTFYDILELYQQTIANANTWKSLATVDPYFSNVANYCQASADLQLQALYRIYYVWSELEAKGLMPIDDGRLASEAKDLMQKAGWYTLTVSVMTSSDYWNDPLLKHHSDTFNKIELLVETLAFLDAIDDG